MRINSVFCSILLFTFYEINAQEHKVLINHYDGTEIKCTRYFPMKDGRFNDDISGIWDISVDSTAVDERCTTIDYTVNCRLVEGSASQVSVGVEFLFNDWSSENFVFVPSIVYNGNRFNRKTMNYPPYWYDESEWKVDMPTTTTLVPSLEKYSDKGVIELTTGNASTPLMSFYSPGNSFSWMVQTTQGHALGDFGYFIREDKQAGKASFSVMSPAVRKKRATGIGFTDSGDRGADLNPGDSVEIRFRIYRERSSSLSDMYSLFLRARKDLNPSHTDYAVMLFSEVWDVMDNLFQKERWNDDIDMYCLTKPGSNRNWNQIWQLGWVGGGQVTLPILLSGDAEGIERSIKNLNAIFTKTQAPSGMYYAYGNGTEFKSFGFGKAFENNETFVRSQGDFLYMAQLQFEQIIRMGRKIPQSWYTSLRKQADAFLSLWKKYGQVGQFVDIENGKICIGGSTAGAIVPAGLAMASRTFGDKEYLYVAEELGEKFYRDYVLKGYTTGGPGEILSTPDSESAFALFESYTVLYDITGDRKWLTYLKELLPICASWVVSYDFNFPKGSVMSDIGAHSTGAVWASVANKHGAPAICTWSGESLLKYCRATGDRYALELLKDIAHGVPQYISHKDRPIGRMEPGGACERVNLSDWEGKRNIGGNLFASCSWVETATMLTVTQIPGIYVQKDAGLVEVFDHVTAEITGHDGYKLKLKVSNPTRYNATVRIYCETAEEARNGIYSIKDESKIRTVRIRKNSSVDIIL